jgi:protein-disulfide isomerase
MSENRGTWIAALIVGVAFVAGSAIVAGALSRGSTEIRAGLDEVKGAVADTKTALLAGAQPAAAPQPARRRGPDPDKRYEVAVNGSPTLGPDTAKIKIIEFSDFQCPFCKRVGPTLQQVKKEYGDKVQIVWKHMPLSFHAKAPAAHKASWAAHKQGKFWEMHDKIFENQREMSDAKYVEWAGELGLDVEKFKTDAASPEAQAVLDEDVKTASSVQVTGTPAFFVNGRFLSGAQPFDAFKRLIDQGLQQDS